MSDDTVPDDARCACRRAGHSEHAAGSRCIRMYDDDPATGKAMGVCLPCACQCLPEMAADRYARRERPDPGDKELQDWIDKREGGGE